tara:strand:+ start:114 stop:530 length:417 start_codon:yes stop_codon:yes gene_type:complete
MNLIYINEIGSDWTGNNIYEFLFSDTLEDIHGDDWDSYPASGNPGPPEPEFVKKVGRLVTDLKFDLIQNSDTFAVFDAVDGVIALGWENLLDYDEYPEVRLYFKFGEGVNNIEDRLYEKDLVLDYNYNNVKKINEDEN